MRSPRMTRFSHGRDPDRETRPHRRKPPALGVGGVLKLGNLDRLPPGARAELLRVLTSPPRVRADVIRQFYERPGGQDMAELLMDLEEDDFLRAAVIERLRDRSQ
jgi:hypothetical protein